jgi:hypothetical protein
MILLCADCPDNQNHGRYDKEDDADEQSASPSGPTLHRVLVQLAQGAVPAESFAAALLHAVEFILPDFQGQLLAETGPLDESHGLRQHRRLFPVQASESYDLEFPI